jgi:phosphoribosyl 1,2-cyclic phosphodiesterase
MSFRSPEQGSLFAELDAPAPEAAPARPACAKVRASKPTFELCVLGSGSGGNSSVIRYNQEAFLVDAGFGPLTSAKRLQQAKVRVDQIRAVLVTHLDQDHFRPTWMATLLGFGIKVYVHRWHLSDFELIPGAFEMIHAGLVEVFDDEAFSPIDDITVRPIHLSHDTKGTSGFLIENHVGRVGYATDLGHVPDELIERFTGVDVLAIESNYDPPMQLKSGRPLFLKRRIMGHAGHLSNQQCFEAVCRIIDRSPPGSPKHIVLLHRSQQCNCPNILREVFAQDLRVAGRVHLSEQRKRSRWFPIERRATAPREQMLFE